MIAQEVETEVEERSRDGLAVDLKMTLDEMPAARSHEQRGDVLSELVKLVALLVADCPVKCVREIALSLDHVLPRRRVCILEVGHEDVRTGVECVDNHFAIGRTSDLDSAIREVGRRRRHAPVAEADLLSLFQEIRELPVAEPL